jgi:hypothetical protein
MRFKSQTELATHLDLLFIRNQDRQRKEGTRTYRQWYCKESQWITDFGSLKRSDADKVPSSSASASSTMNTTNKSHDGKQLAESQDEEMVLPADEHFTRCPVSNEAFLPEWDTEEGDYMYRNAVKVLITEKADPLLYKMAQPTDYPLIRYIIVHQKLVMDGWLAAGKSGSLSETIPKIQQRYGVESAVSRVLVSAYTQAAGEEEDSNDIFVLFEPMDRSNELAISDTIYRHETAPTQQQQAVLEEKAEECVEEPNEQDGTEEQTAQAEAERGEQTEEDGVAEMKMELQDP